MGSLGAILGLFGGLLGGPEELNIRIFATARILRASEGPVFAIIRNLRYFEIPMFTITRVLRASDRAQLHDYT